MIVVAVVLAVLKQVVMLQKVPLLPFQMENSPHQLILDYATLVWRSQKMLPFSMVELLTYIAVTPALKKPGYLIASAALSATERLLRY